MTWTKYDSKCRRKRGQLESDEREGKLRRKIYDTKDRKVQPILRRLRYPTQKLTLECWFGRNTHHDKIKIRGIAE